MVRRFLKEVDYIVFCLLCLFAAETIVVLEMIKILSHLVDKKAGFYLMVFMAIFQAVGFIMIFIKDYLEFKTIAEKKY